MSPATLLARSSRGRSLANYRQAFLFWVRSDPRPTMSNYSRVMGDCQSLPTSGAGQSHL